MAKTIPGRSENDIKNKWNSMMRKEQRSRGKAECKHDPSDEDAVSDFEVNYYEHSFGQETEDDSMPPSLDFS